MGSGGYVRKNPIEVIEDLIFTQEWVSQRLSDNEVMAEVRGRWCDYNIHFVWTEDSSILQFFIILVDIQVPNDKKKEVYELICDLNERLPLGHFEVFMKIKTPVFRHALLLPGTRTLSEALLEQLLDIGLEACEKFYPSFQFVIFGNKTPEDAVSMSMIDVAGEA